MWGSTFDSSDVNLSYSTMTNNIAYNHHTDIYPQTCIFIRKQGLNATGAAALQDSFLNTGACSSSGLSILGIAGNNPVCVSTSTTPTMFLAKPITPTPKSGSCRSLDTVNFAVTVVMLSSAVVYALM